MSEDTKDPKEEPNESQLSPGQILYRQVSEQAGSDNPGENLLHVAEQLRAAQARANRPPPGFVLIRIVLFVVVVSVFVLGGRGVWNIIQGKGTFLDILLAGVFAFMVANYFRWRG